MSKSRSARRFAVRASIVLGAVIAGSSSHFALASTVQQRAPHPSVQSVAQVSARETTASAVAVHEFAPAGHALRAAGLAQVAKPAAKALTKASVKPAKPKRAKPAAYGCGAALSYLRKHAAPGFRLDCPGNSHGHQAMTCVNAEYCPGFKLIAITVPCPAAYKNEASNSWVLIGESDRVIDPYGYCH